MKIFSFILLLFASINSYAQDRTHYYGLNSNILQNIDISHPRLNIGIEKYFNEKSISINLGVFYHNWFFEDTPKNSFSIGGEYKWFKSNGLHYIIGTDIGFLEYNGIERLDVNNEEKNFIIKKFRSDLYFNVGFRKSIGKLFYIDYFGGLGIRYRQTKHFERIVPEDEKELDFTVLDMRNTAGNKFVPIMKLGIRLGLKI